MIALRAQIGAVPPERQEAVDNLIAHAETLNCQILDDELVRSIREFLNYRAGEFRCVKCGKVVTWLSRICWECV